MAPSGEYESLFQMTLSAVLLLSVMNYCRASFEIMTHIRQMAPLLYIINCSKLRSRVNNWTTLISAKKSCRSEQYFCRTEWPRFFGPPCMQTKSNSIFENWKLPAAMAQNEKRQLMANRIQKNRISYRSTETGRISCAKHQEPRVLG